MLRAARSTFQTRLRRIVRRTARLPCVDACLQVASEGVPGSRRVGRRVIDGAVRGRPAGPRRGRGRDRPAEAQGRGRRAGPPRDRPTRSVDGRRRPLVRRPGRQPGRGRSHLSRARLLLLPAPSRRAVPSGAAARIAHWPTIACPALLLCGESDPFARIELLRAAMPTLAARRARHLAAPRPHAEAGPRRGPRPGGRVHPRPCPTRRRGSEPGAYLAIASGSWFSGRR